MRALADRAISVAILAMSASLAAGAVLALTARLEGKSAVQPLNATSHWLHGPRAAAVKEFDAAHSLVGYATHHAAMVFWAVPFEFWLASRPPRNPAVLLRNAVVMAAIAAAVDYGLTPKRFTPGWELALSKRSMLATYGGMALGLATGAIAARNLRRPPQPS